MMKIHNAKIFDFGTGKAGFKEHKLQGCGEKYPKIQGRGTGNMHILDIRLCCFYNEFSRFERSFYKITCMEHKQS